MFADALCDKAARVLDGCRAQALRLATAESCTGGLIAGCLTEIAGSSNVLECGVVTYTNQAKTELLGVPASLLERVGAVSEEVARAMAEGALALAPAQISVACTGIAGPAGATAGKPVGLVHLAAARTGRPVLHERFTYGDIGRRAVRLASVDDALDLLLAQLGN